MRCCRTSSCPWSRHETLATTPHSASWIWIFPARKREVLGERDLSMTEVTAAIAQGIGKPDLRYEQFSYDQVRQVLVQAGWSPKKAAVYIEMFEAINGGVLAAQEPRSPQNSTPTTFEEFVQDVFV